jgi:hypothetical protein
MTPRWRLTPTIPATRKASEHGDLSVSMTWAVKGKDLFLDDRQAAFDVGAPAVGSRHGVIARVRRMGGLRCPVWHRASPQAKSRRHFRTMISLG